MAIPATADVVHPLSASARASAMLGIRRFGRFLICGGMMAACAGCLSLSFGGKHEHLPSVEVSELSALEERVQALEERIRGGPCDSPPAAGATTNEPLRLAPAFPNESEP